MRHGVARQGYEDDVVAAGGIGAHLEALPGYANRCIGDLLAHADQLDLRVLM